MGNKMFYFGDGPLSPSTVFDILDKKTDCGISSEGRERINRSAQLVEDIVASGNVVYGVNTGFGALASERISADNRKSTRLNSSHVKISYAVFCLKKKKYIV